MEQQEPIQENTSQDITQLPDKPKKKKRIGLFFTLGVLLVIIGVILWIVGSLFFFKPRDLGIRYTEADYNNAIEKIKISISINGESGKSLKDIEKSKDDNWHYDDFRREKLTLTASEFSALVDSITPTFGDIQVKGTAGGIIEGSSAVSFDAIKNMLGDQIDQVPLKIPDKGSANIYTKLNLTVKDNKVTASAVALEIGVIPLPEDVLKNITIADQLETAFGSVPGLVIHSLTTDESGNFIFDGTYPHKVNITPNN